MNKTYQVQYDYTPYDIKELFKITPLAFPATITITKPAEIPTEPAEPPTEGKYIKTAVWSMQYSYDGLYWTEIEWTSDTEINITANAPIYLRSRCYVLWSDGIQTPYTFGWFYDRAGQWNSYIFTLSCNQLYKVSGKLKNFAQWTKYLFMDQTNLVDASKLILLGYQGDYVRMFQNCTNLEYAPKILELSYLGTSSGYSGEGRCYRMFDGCTKLLTVPKLPTLYDYTYQKTSIVNGQIVIDEEYNVLSKEVYLFMFNNCTSLTQIPKLPANVVSDHAYRCMFANTGVDYSSNITSANIYEYRIPTEGTFTWHNDSSGSENFNKPTWELIGFPIAASTERILYFNKPSI